MHTNEISILIFDDQQDTLNSFEECLTLADIRNIRLERDPRYAAHCIQERHFL
jgi:hypothetical protein